MPSRVKLNLILSCCLWMLLRTQAGFCQTLEPLELAKRIFDKEGFADLPNYIEGNDYNGHPNGQDLPKNSTTRFQLLSQTDQRAVVALTVLERPDYGVDWYLFFTKKSEWKLYAQRALAMNGFSIYKRKMLERLSSRQIDSVIRVAKANPKIAPFSSRKGYAYELGNARLMTSMDDQLIRYFKEHKTEFEQLKQLVLNGRKKTGSQEQIEQSWKPAYEKLFLSLVPFGDYNFTGAVELVIGGVSDNQVGYVYIANKKNLPAMSADLIIMLREIGNGWYVYKTT